MLEPVAVYVHIPFCPSKCGYCDFNSFAMSGGIVERTTAAIIREIARGPHVGRSAKTIFFGGGTPTFLEPEAQVSILDAVVRAHPPVEGCEITTEANPGTVDAAKFRALKSAGFNRLSIGAQSFDPGELKVLDRVHSPDEVVRAVSAARDAGFDNLSLDLMFALPDQSMRRWSKNLESAFALEPDHLSLYCLTIEPATRFYKLHLQGRLSQPDDQIQSEMYDATVAVARESGFERYEISNFARPGRECAHNLCYWRGEEYVGYGPGAVERVGDTRRTNMKHPERYCETIESESELACETESLDASKARVERIMLGLRLREGVDPVDISSAAIAKLVAKGWITANGRVRLTDAGAHYCNQVIVDLL
ncbi:MAG: radical SAM family heme chaperone HemW [Armatimonadota bacterium]|nr:radical SAM family heme chaperone HemW [Armatimonadota bacterium]